MTNDKKLRVARDIILNPHRVQVPWLDNYKMNGFTKHTAKRKLSWTTVKENVEYTADVTPNDTFVLRLFDITINSYNMYLRTSLKMEDVDVTSEVYLREVRDLDEGKIRADIWADVFAAQYVNRFVDSVEDISETMKAYNEEGTT